MFAIAKSTPLVGTKYTYKPPLKNVKRTNDYLSIAERVNGRAAMIGFTSAVVDKLMTGTPVVEQFHDHAGLAVAVSALTFLGTATNPNDEGYVQGFFKPENELINGRLAMIGVTALLLTQA